MRHYLYFCTSKASKLNTCRRRQRPHGDTDWPHLAARAPYRWGGLRVSICTFVLVKQVNPNFELGVPSTREFDSFACTRIVSAANFLKQFLTSISHPAGSSSPAASLSLMNICLAVDSRPKTAVYTSFFHFTTQFACFTGTKVQILTQSEDTFFEVRPVRHALYICASASVFVLLYQESK
jgi:hypothetical protein